MKKVAECLIGSAKYAMHHGGVPCPPLVSSQQVDFDAASQSVGELALSRYKICRMQTKTHTRGTHNWLERLSRTDGREKMVCSGARIINS